MISVIIPVYNAERFLRATVQSVIDQDYSDFEILLIDDGSTDMSGEICDELASEHQQITVIHKPNGGVSQARNAGIEAAKGKYLTFIDSDDFIDKHMLADLVNEFEAKNVDKVFCGFEEIHEDGVCFGHIANLPPRKILNRNEVIYTLLYTGCSSNSYMNTVCGGVYKTSIIKKHNLKFENRPMGEDWLFNMKYCDFIQSAVYIDKPYYKYFRNSTSATSRYQPRQFELWLENRDFRQSLVSKYNFEIDQQAIDSNWVNNVLYYSLQVIQHEPNYKNKLIEIFKNDEFNFALKNASRNTPYYFIPVVWLLRNCHLTMAILILRFYSICI